VRTQGRASATRIPARSARVADNPSRDALIELALEHPHAQRTGFGSLSVTSRAAGWSRPSTFLVSDDPEGAPFQAISREEAARIAALQESHLANADVVRLDRSVGANETCQVGTALIVERAHAHVAAVWDLLSYPESRPGAHIVCTPGLRIGGYPDGRVIAVDLEEGVTRICGTDFPGEAKRAGLRAWGLYAWEQGGLPLHAAVKVTQDGRPLVIAGLPGTGKTSIAFAPSAITSPCQEDRVAWLPDGTLVAAEHAFFAPANRNGPRPLVERALADRNSVLLNVVGRRHIASAFAPVGRVVFDAPPLQAGSRPQTLILLVRNQNVLPAVARLDARTAAAVFTASNTEHGRVGAAGAMRATLGASPLFPISAAAEGLRLLELLERHGTEVHVLNTWRVGGPDDRAGSLKVLPEESAALVDAIAAGEIEWGALDDLGCTVPASMNRAGVRPDVLDPRSLYARQGRIEEYRMLVARLRAQWDDALAAVDAERALSV
jgi:phosphoenolpyruvate carboxykinase (ATP)